MKRYFLTCPFCAEENSIEISLDKPEEPRCASCEESIDIKTLKQNCQAWLEYIQDVEKMLEIESNGDNGTQTEEAGKKGA